MIIYKINLDSFITQGNVSVDVNSNELNVIANTAVKFWAVDDNVPIKSLLYLPDKYKLPFRVDMTVKIDSPALWLLIGKGHVGFATGMDNRKITDILGGENKPNTHFFDNTLPMNQYANISVTYGMKAMWVLINNELRCISRKDPYIKALKKAALPEEFSDGFSFALTCDKRTRMTLKSVTITEYEVEGDEPIEPEETDQINPLPVCLSVSNKPTLNECIQGLEPDLQRAVVCTDDYLLKDMKRNLNFNRKIEGGYPCSKISYVSPLDLSYKIHITGATLRHQLVWIRYNTKREQEKYQGLKKSDYTNEALNELMKKSPELAERIFFCIRECFACIKDCKYRVIYECNGRKKVSCDDIFGGIHFKMFPSDFEDLRNLINAINTIIS